MNWISTIHEGRSSLMEHLEFEASSFCVRGNIIWVILDNHLIAYEIQKEGEFWQYKKLNEPQFTKDHLSCPAAYLASKEQNPEWRKDLQKRLETNKNLKQQIESAFKEAESLKCKLVIVVKTETKGEFELEVETLIPLSGRNCNSKLYKIPLRRIISWQIK